MLLDARANADVLAATGATRADLTRWRKDPVFASLLSELRAERRQSMLDTMDAAVPDAVNALRCAVRGTNLPGGGKVDKVTVMAAQTILDRGGVPKTERIEHGGNGGVLRVAGLKELSRDQLEAMAGGDEEDEDEVARGNG